MNSIIHTINLKKAFSENEAVHDLNLSVPEGSIYAFLGPNGAGKTTTIKMLMNLVQATSGEALVLGVNSTQLGPPQFMEIGYVSENQSQPLWMTVRQLMDFCAPLYPAWDRDLERKLLRDFDVPETQKLGNLSRGMLMKAMLVSSLAYRPKLLILDEPFSGLDALIREEFTQAILETSDREGWTVFISSHDIDEVERLASHIGIIDKGVLHYSDPIEHLQEKFRRVTVRFDGDVMLPSDVNPSWLQVEQSGQLLQFVDSNFCGDESAWHAIFPGASFSHTGMSLKEIFVAVARSLRNKDDFDAQK